jgi:hypothetical protein
MTSEMINAEPEGRRMDAWVAVYVAKTFTEGLLDMNRVDNMPLNGGVDKDGNEFPGMLEYYSTDMGAAWLIVLEIGSPLEMYYFQSGQKCVVRLPSRNEISVTATSMPLAICRAALHCILANQPA